MEPTEIGTNAAPFTYGLAIEKVDKATRRVRGVVTAEIVDQHGQIVDYESAKSAFSSWAGNIREMHQAVAVGKKVDIEFDDEKKQITLESYVSRGAEDTWTKVVEEVLTGYSLGGVAKIAADKVAPKGRLFMQSITETSLVDNPACPVAKFDVVKLADASEPAVAPETVAEPVSIDTAGDTTPAVKSLREQLLELAPTERLAKGLELVNVAKLGYPETYDITDALSCIAILQRLVSSEFYEATISDADAQLYGVDVTHAREQLAALKAAAQLVLAFVTSEFNHQFDGSTMSAAKAASIAKTHLEALPFVWSRLDSAGQLWTAKAGARHSKGDVEMLQSMHDTAVALGANCTTEKAAAAAVPAQETPVSTEKPAAAAETPAVPEVTKAADAAPVTETPVTPTEPAAASAASAEPVVKLADVETLVATKLAEALATQRAESNRTIAELSARVEKLAAEPVPGGPVTRAVPVTKEIGAAAQTGTGAGVNPTDVANVLVELAKQAKTEEERTRIAEGLIRLQHTTGAGVVPIGR